MLMIWQWFNGSSCVENWGGVHPWMESQALKEFKPNQSRHQHYTGFLLHFGQASAWSRPRAITKYHLTDMTKAGKLDVLDIRSWLTFNQDKYETILCDGKRKDKERSGERNQSASGRIQTHWATHISSRPVGSYLVVVVVISSPLRTPTDVHMPRSILMTFSGKSLHKISNQICTLNNFIHIRADFKFSLQIDVWLQFQ